MKNTQQYLDELTYKIIGCAIEVHKQLGPGLLENVYEQCFIRELSLQGLDHKTQIWIPVFYKGLRLETQLRLDVLVEDLIIVELKSVEHLMAIHDAKLLTYMKLMKRPKGILINFNCTNIFKEGQKTFVNQLYANLPYE
ncbi:GxxExxY protein [Agriterribacter sp.]|uniref:GxxExxY protein n=1 Tax=Agriterribacter sp. TaxID=2821509 RepID=UPI002CEAB876|nr:GxxExxY protein [Agriterribacter sp.]HRP55928.1 GxxExxY protein [Agriterribacter sp.]